MDVVWPRVRRGDFLHKAIFPDCPGKSVMVSCLSLSLKMRWAGKRVKISVQSHCHAMRTTEHATAVPAQGSRQQRSTTLLSHSLQCKWVPQVILQYLFCQSKPTRMQHPRDLATYTLVRALDKDGARPGPQHPQLSSGWLWRNVQHFGGGFPWAYQRVRSSSTLYTTRSFQLTFAVPLVDYVSSLVPLTI